MLWLGAVAMVVAFFVADYNDGKPEPTTHAPTATTQQESTGGHVVATTSSSSVSHTATSSQATSAGSSNTYNASSSLEPSVQESPGPPANVGVALAEDPWVAQPGETVEYRVKLINHGQGEATRIEVTEELPQGLSFEDGSRRQTKVVENLASGDDKVVVFLVTVSGDTPRGHYRSVVTVLRVDAVNTRSTESMRSLTVRP
ncbi:MAG: NEW3 domain-containing protein [Candidatus Spechtbacterales bacterium]|nr:NEW3 domain-containing protein [Candidatus Spechtbacterales bacterium]